MARRLSACWLGTSGWTVRLCVVRNSANTLPLANLILVQSETSVVQGSITIQQPGLSLICHWKITLWRIVGTKWVVKRDAIAGRRTDRKSYNKKELPKRMGNRPHTGRGLQQFKQKQSKHKLVMPHDLAGMSVV